MQPSGQYGMSGPMQSGMGMSGMSMSRSGMMGPASGYGMSAAAGQGSYPMQSRVKKKFSQKIFRLSNLFHRPVVE